MKKTIFSFFLLVFFPVSNYAQKGYSLQMEEASLNDTGDSITNHQSNLFYFSFGTALTNYDLGALANIIFHEKWKGSISYRYGDLKAKNIPGNYEGSCFWGDNCREPGDKIPTINARLGRTSPNISSTSNVRVGYEIGPSFLFYKEAHFTPGGSWFGGNYNTNYTKKFTFGLSLRTNVEFIFFNSFWADMALSINVNKYRSFGALELDLLIGKLRNKKTK